MDLIYTDSQHVDQAVLDNYVLDLAYGEDENDFVITVPAEGTKLEYGSLIYVAGTEYGGVVDARSRNTSKQYISYKGRTWHGILEKKIVEPSSGQDYYKASGDAHTIIANLISRVGLTDIFEAKSKASGLILEYQFHRYIDVYSGLRKMLLNEGYKLKFEKSSSKVILSVEPIVDYSINHEFDDEELHFEIEENHRPINHLICRGGGELKDQIVIHFYADEKGNVSRQQSLFGIDELVETYDYFNTDYDELFEAGTEKLEEMQKVNSLEIPLGPSMNFDVDDIVGARESLSGTCIKNHIIKKIVTLSKDKAGARMSIHHEVGDSVGSLSEQAESKLIVAGEGLEFIGNELVADVKAKDLEEVKEEVEEKTKTFLGADFPEPSYREGDRFVNEETGIEYVCIHTELAPEPDDEDEEDEDEVIPVEDEEE